MDEQLSEAARMERNAYMREWKRANQERVKGYHERYRAANPERIKQHRKKYWEKKAQAKLLGEEE